MSSPTDVIIVGGSLAGLMHALVLRSLGRNVVIFEARPFQELQARAAGLSLWPHAQKLITKYVPDVDLDAIAFRNPGVQMRTGDGALLVEIPGRDDVRTTNWAIVHGLLLKACEKRSEGDGSINFEMGKRVAGVREEGDTMVVTYKDGGGIERESTAALIIAADGSRSFIRSKVMPDVTAQYAGYIAWRGRIKETEGPEELAGALEGKLVIFRFQGSYVLVYLTPGENGSMKPGERLLEWCWYDICDASSSTFAEFFTDKHGIQHNHTVPADLLSSDVWRSQIFRRRDTVSPLWQRLFALSSVPLLTAITSFDNTRSAFFDGKLFLVGEAFMQIRPHLGASCSIPALQALKIGEVLAGELTGAEAHREVVEYATEKAIGSKAVGDRGFSSG